MKSSVPDTILYEKGYTILEEGSPGDSAFIIVAGEVSVYKKNRQNKDTLVARLGPNELIGEVGFFTNRPVRTASVIAFTDTVELMELKRSDFEEEFAGMSPAMRMVMKALIQRLRQNYSKIALLS